MKKIKTDFERIVLISDIHLGVRSASEEWIENIVNYFNNFFFPKLKELADEKKTAVIIAGDFFDNRKNIDISVMNTGMVLIEKMSEISEVYMIIGNHDIYKKKDTGINSLAVFKYFKGVHIIEELSTLEVKNGKKFLLVSWVGDPAEETNILMKNKNNSDIAILHSDIAGFKYDNGRPIIKGVNSTIYDTGKIYSGHIHKHDVAGNVTYIGCPYQLKRSDLGNDKGFYILDFNDDGTVNEKFVINTYSPKFLKVHFDDILELTINQIREFATNNYVDIILPSKYKNFINLSKLMEVMESCNSRKIIFLIDKSDNVIGDIAVERRQDLTVEEVFNSYVEKMELSKDTKDKLEKMNNDYLAQAAEFYSYED